MTSAGYCEAFLKYNIMKLVMPLSNGKTCEEILFNKTYVILRIQMYEFYIQKLVTGNSVDRATCSKE